MQVFFVAGFFVFVGLAVALIAMRGGPSSAITPQEPSRDARKATTIFVTLVVAIMGIGLPTFVLLHNEDSGAAQAPGGKDLTADQQEGRHLFADKCATCHTLGDAGAVGKVGPNLDTLRPGKTIILTAVENGLARGNGQMPAGLLQGEDAEHVSKYIEGVAGR